MVGGTRETPHNPQTYCHPSLCRILLPTAQPSPAQPTHPPPPLTLRTMGSVRMLWISGSAIALACRSFSSASLTSPRLSCSTPRRAGQ